MITKTHILLAIASLLLGLAGSLAIAQPADNAIATGNKANKTTEADAEPTSQTEPEPPEQTPEPLLYPDRSQRDMAMLAAEVPTDDVVWLETESEKFLALFEADYSGSPKGAVLLLHAEGQHPNWPQTIRAIRTGLPEFGWTTLAITLPVPSSPPIPKRSPPPPPKAEADKEGSSEDTPEENPATGEEASAAPESDTPRPESEEIFDDQNNQIGDGSINPTTTPVDTPAPPTVSIETKVAQRLAAAMEYLHNKGQFNIVLLGSGYSAARTGQYFASIQGPSSADSDAIKTVRAVVIVNARNQLPSDEVTLFSGFHDPEIPILDIYFGVDRRDQLEARQRKKQALRKKILIYQQIRLPELNSATSTSANRLSKRVRGFLEKHARGAEVDNVKVMRN